MIRQGLIHIEEIDPPALESSYHIGSRDIVAPLPYSACNPTQSELGRSESNVDYFDPASRHCRLCGTRPRFGGTTPAGHVGVAASLERCLHTPLELISTRIECWSILALRVSISPSELSI
jgi:hypothetical protein